MITTNTTAGAHEIFEPKVEEKQFPGIKNFFYFEKRMHPDDVDQEIESIYDMIEDQDCDELDALDFDVWTATPDDHENLVDESHNRMIVGIAVKMEEPMPTELIDKVLMLHPDLRYANIEACKSIYCKYKLAEEEDDEEAAEEISDKVGEALEDYITKNNISPSDER